MYYAASLWDTAPPAEHWIALQERRANAVPCSDGADECECREGTTTCGGFPRILHQTWKTSTLPPTLQVWSGSWKEHNPHYELRLWSDADNYAFLKAHYPWFVRYYSAYDSNIKRADAVRIFYMYHYGGIYADLDFVCVRPFDALLLQNKDAEVIFGWLKLLTGLLDCA